MFMFTFLTKFKYSNTKKTDKLCYIINQKYLYIATKSTVVLKDLLLKIVFYFTHKM